MRHKPRRPAAQPPLVSLATFLATVAPVLALAVCSALYLRQLGLYLDPRLAPLVAQAAADSLHREVRIDHISVFERPGVVVLKGIDVSNGPTFKSGHGLAIAQVPQAVVDYDLPRLVGDPADAVRAIRSVELTHPAVFAEQLTPGKFNLSSLIKPPNPAKPFPFRGVVLVKNGKLTVRDDNAPKILGVQQNEFTGVNATVDLTTPGRVVFRGAAAGRPDRFASVRINGDVLDPPARAPSSALRGYSLRAQVTRGNVPYLTDYFAPFLRKTLRVRQGIGDADVTIGQFGTATPGPLTILGRVTVQDGDASLINQNILQRPLESVNTRLTFTTKDLAIDGLATVSGIPVAVHGAIFDFSHPVLALAIDSNAATYSGLKAALSFIPTLPSGMSISSPATASTWVTGDLRNPSVEASAALPSIDCSGTDLTAIRAKASFQDGVLRVVQAEATAPATDGFLNVSGYVNTRSAPLVYGVAGTAVNVNVAGLPLSAALKRQAGPLRGIASARFQASNLGVQADVSVSRASVRQVAFNDVSGRVLWSAGRAVELHRLVAHLADGGVFYADGRIPVGTSRSGSWDLSVQASQIGLGRLIRPFVKLPIGGELYLFGTLRGPEAIPQLTGNVTVLVPHYGSYVADQLKGTFTATTAGVQIERAVIQRFPGTAAITGRVTHLASGDPSLDLHVAVRGAQLSDVTRLAAQHSATPSVARVAAASLPTLTGEVAADLGVTGSFKNPRIAGQLTVTDATYSSLELDAARAVIAYSGNVLHMSRLTASGTGFQLQGAGSYGLLTHRISAQVSSSIDDVGRLLPASYHGPLVAGPITATLTATGTSENPFATAQVAGQNLTVSGAALDDVSIAATYHRGEIFSADGGLKVSAGTARYLVPNFRYDPHTTMFSLAGQVTGETVGHVLALARSVRSAPGQAAFLQSFLARVPQDAGGQIALPMIQAEGTLKNPAAHVVLDANDLVYGDERLDRLNADVKYADGAFDVASLEARGEPNAYLSAAGHVDPAGSVNAHLEASGIDLAPLNGFLPLKMPLGGQISDLTIVASGQTRAPVLDASVTLERPSYGTYFVDSLDSGRISIADNRITVNGLQIVKAEKDPSGQVIEHYASVRGALPFAWKSGAALTPVFPRNVPLSFSLTIPPQNLSSIPALFPGVPLKFPTGTVSANIGLGGTLDNKQFTGSLVVTNGSMQSSQLKTGLHDINVDLSLVGDQARLTLAADSTAGGSIHVTGGASLAAVASLTSGAATNATQFANELVDSVHLNLKAAATDFSVNEPKISQFGNAGFRGQLNGTVQVTQALRSPLVAGSVTLSDAVGVLPSLAQTAGEAAPTPLVNPQFQLGVTVARGSRLRNSSLNAQIDGALTVAGTLGQPDVNGDFAIRQGQFFFPTATFRVIPVGTVHLAYVPPSDPVERVDLTARTQIAVSDATIAANPTGAGSEPDAYTAPRYSPASQTARNYTVTVKIQGLLNNPDKLSLDFQSDPPGLTQKQILATLGGQQALTGGVATIFTNLAVPVALQPVERGIASGLGLEDFSVAYAPDAPVQLTFVKRLGRRVELTYTQMVNSRSTGAVANTLEPPIYQLKLDYSFTDRFRLSLSTDDQRNTIIGLERVYSF